MINSSFPYAIQGSEGSHHGHIDIYASAVRVGRNAIFQAEAHSPIVTNWNSNINQPWAKMHNGRRVDVFSPCCCICIGGRGNGKEAVIMLVVLFAFSFFVSLFYTCKTIGKIFSLNNNVTEARSKSIDFALRNQQLQQPLQPQLIQPQPSAPPLDEQLNAPAFTIHAGNQALVQPQVQPPQGNVVQPFNPEAACQQICEKSAQVLKKVKLERKITLISQLMLTTGLGLVTVALLVIVITEPYFLFIGLGAAGGGLVVVGATIYGVKHAALSWNNEQNLCNEISDLMSQLHDKNYWYNLTP